VWAFGGFYDGGRPERRQSLAPTPSAGLNETVGRLRQRARRHPTFTRRGRRGGGEEPRAATGEARGNHKLPQGGKGARARLTDPPISGWEGVAGHSRLGRARPPRDPGRNERGEPESRKDRLDRKKETPPPPRGPAPQESRPHLRVTDRKGNP